MKTKKAKLGLKKETITNLNKSELNQIVGGHVSVLLACATRIEPTCTEDPTEDTICACIRTN